MNYVLMWIVAWGMLTQADPVTPVKKISPPFILPVVAVPVTDPPAPVDPVSPDTPILLKQKQLLVVRRQAKFFVKAMPREMVTIKPLQGPLTAWGWFVGEKDEDLDKTFTEPFLAVIKAVPGKVGRVEIALIPADGVIEDIEDITTILIDIGVAPQPPPVVVIPDPPPVIPDPPAPVQPVGFRVIFAFDTMSALTTGEKLNSIYSTKIVEYLNRKCAKGPDGKLPEWRKWSFNVVTTEQESKEMVALWNQSKPQFKQGPQVVIANGKVVVVANVPETEAETLALLKKYGGE